jgi:hypothetical protein
MERYFILEITSYEAAEYSLRGLLYMYFDVDYIFILIKKCEKPINLINIHTNVQKYNEDAALFSNLTLNITISRFKKK